MNVAWHAAVVLTVIAGRGVFLLFAPFRECRWCRPGGLLSGSWPGAAFAHRAPRRRRGRRCWRCHGHRQTRRWGAYHVHKVKMSLVQAWDEREWRR
jgi:hypothetical protein